MKNSQTFRIARQRIGNGGASVRRAGLIDAMTADRRRGTRGMEGEPEGAEGAARGQRERKGRMERGVVRPRPSVVPPLPPREASYPALPRPLVRRA